MPVGEALRLCAAWCAHQKNPDGITCWHRIHTEYGTQESYRSRGDTGEHDYDGDTDVQHTGPSAQVPTSDLTVAPGAHDQQLRQDKLESKSTGQEGQRDDVLLQSDPTKVDGNGSPQSRPSDRSGASVTADSAPIEDEDAADEGHVRSPIREDDDSDDGRNELQVGYASAATADTHCV